MPKAISATAEGESTDDGETCHLKNVLQGLPIDAVKELLSLRVCVCCILRLFGIQGFCSSRILSSLIGGPTDLDNGVAESGFGDSKQSCNLISKEFRLCSLCLGILQFTFYDDRDMLVIKDNANDLAVLIANTVKREGHQVEDFSLEVSIPQIIPQNDHSTWLHLKMKYEDEPWFQEKLCCEQISVKDALKCSIVNILEKLLDCKAGISSFHIRLTYCQMTTSTEDAKISDRTGNCKRRKTGEGRMGIVSRLVPCNEQLDSSKVETDAKGERPLNTLSDLESSNSSKLFPEKENQPCHLKVECYRLPIYFGGRYLKYSRNVSQTCWIVDDERIGETSVEEIIGGNILPMCCGDNYKFHAAGREDIDVRMLGPGRPFLLEIQNARCLPSDGFVKDTETQINNLENKLVGVKHLKLVGSHGWDLMREGEAEKQKQYAALVWVSHPLKNEDLQIVSSIKDIKIMQRTPIRVLHRRSPLEREKTIHWMKMETVDENFQYFLLHLCTQAGTYIKEFVHGDLGRTHPSIGSILGCRAEILQLDVTDVKMDCFLAE